MIFDGDHMQCGCERHLIEDWSQFDNKRIVSMDGKAALEFWGAHRDELLATARALKGAV